MIALLAREDRRLEIGLHDGCLESHEGLAVDPHPATVEACLRDRVGRPRPAVAAVTARLDALSPLAVLSRGYAIVYREPEGVIVQFGGQTAVNLANPLANAGMPIIGSSANVIDLAEDRRRFSALCGSLGVRQPPHGIA